MLRLANSALFRFPSQIESIAKAVYFACHLSRNLPQQFSAANSKSAYVASSMIKLAAGVAVLTSAILLIAALYCWYTMDEVSPERIMELIISYPILFIIGLFMAGKNLSNILHRLNELDPNDT